MSKQALCALHPPCHNKRIFSEVIRGKPFIVKKMAVVGASKMTTSHGHSLIEVHAEAPLALLGLTCASEVASKAITTEEPDSWSGFEQQLANLIAPKTPRSIALEMEARAHKRMRRVEINESDANEIEFRVGGESAHGLREQDFIAVKE